MTHADILTLVVERLSEVTGTPVDEFLEQATSGVALAIDSLDAIEVVVALEAELSVDLGHDEVTANALTALDSLVELVEGAINARTGDAG